MITIGVDASRANHPERTGTEWYSYELINQWRQVAPSDFKFRLYFDSPPRADLLPLPSWMESKILNWPPVYLWTQVRLSAHLAWHRPHVLFIPAHTIPLIHPRRTVVTIHDIGFEYLKTVYNQAPIGHQESTKKVLNTLARFLTRGRYGSSEYDYQRWAIRHALRTATKIITVSSYTKNDLVRHFNFPAEKIVSIPNAVDHERYRPITDPGVIQRTKTKYGINNPYIFSIGRIELKKNIPILLRAYSKFIQTCPIEMKPLTLVLAGKPGTGYDVIQENIKQNMLQDRVILPGFVPEEDVPILLSGASAFVFPSRFEGFGIPVLQAMACKTPVITSNVTALPEVAGDAAIFVDPNDSDQITSALSQVLTKNKNFRLELIEKGQRRAAQFTWKETARRTLELLLEVSQKDEV